jgi:hypothetical protein
MLIEKADSSLDMGTRTLSAGAGAFTDVLDLGKTDADGMTVNVRATEAGAGGTSVVLKLQGAAAPDAVTWDDIITSKSVVPASLSAGDVAEIPVPRNNGYRCLRMYAVVTGTFTAGILAAQLDTYTRG